MLYKGFSIKPADLPGIDRLAYSIYWRASDGILLPISYQEESIDSAKDFIDLLIDETPRIHFPGQYGEDFRLYLLEENLRQEK